MTFLILSKPDCVWCDKAKVLIKEKGDTYIEVDYKSSPAIIPLMLLSKIRTMPQIWVTYPLSWDYVGGYEDLVEWFVLKSVSSG